MLPKYTHTYIHTYIHTYTHTHTHTHIYIYMCVCVCVAACVCGCTCDDCNLFKDNMCLDYQNYTQSTLIESNATNENNSQHT